MRATPLLMAAPIFLSGCYQQIYQSVEYSSKIDAAISSGLLQEAKKAIDAFEGMCESSREYRNNRYGNTCAGSSIQAYKGIVAMEEGRPQDAEQHFRETIRRIESASEYVDEFPTMWVYMRRTDLSYVHYLLAYAQKGRGVPYLENLRRAYYYDPTWGSGRSCLAEGISIRAVQPFECSIYGDFVASLPAGDKEREKADKFKRVWAAADKVYSELNEKKLKVWNDLYKTHGKIVQESVVNDVRYHKAAREHFEAVVAELPKYDLAEYVPYVDGRLGHYKGWLGTDRKYSPRAYETVYGEPAGNSSSMMGQAMGLALGTYAANKGNREYGAIASVMQGKSTEEAMNEAYGANNSTATAGAGSRKLAPCDPLPGYQQVAAVNSCFKVEKPGGWFNKDARMIKVRLVNTCNQDIKVTGCIGAPGDCARDGADITGLHETLIRANSAEDVGTYGRGAKASANGAIEWLHVACPVKYQGRLVFAKHCFHDKENFRPYRPMLSKTRCWYDGR